VAFSVETHFGRSLQTGCPQRAKKRAVLRFASLRFANWCQRHHRAPTPLRRHKTGVTRMERAIGVAGTGFRTSGGFRDRRRGRMWGKVGCHGVGDASLGSDSKGWPNIPARRRRRTLGMLTILTGVPRSPQLQRICRQAPGGSPAARKWPLRVTKGPQLDFWSSARRCWIALERGRRHGRTRTVSLAVLATVTARKALTRPIVSAHTAKVARHSVVVRLSGILIVDGR